MKKRNSWLFMFALLMITALVVASISAATSAKLQCFNGNTTATTNTIYANLKLVNTGTDVITLSNVKLRYYFTNDGTQTNGFACDWATVGNSNVTGTFTAITPVTNADRYLEIGFSSGAGSLAAGASTEVKVRVWKSDWSNFTQTNDYSFNASATNYVDSTPLQMVRDQPFHRSKRRVITLNRESRLKAAVKAGKMLGISRTGTILFTTVSTLEPAPQAFKPE